VSAEKWDLPEFPVQHRPNETSAVEVKFGGTAASLFEHLRLAPSLEIPVHDTSCRPRRVAGGWIEDFVANCVNTSASTLREGTEISSTPFGARFVMHEDEILRDWLNCSHFLFSACRLRTSDA
jgi:hypothetical protein